MTRLDGDCLAERAIREALAAGPTTGPWMQAHRRNDEGLFNTEVFDHSSEAIALLTWYPKQMGNGVTATYREQNARYIAACNPEAMQALLAEVDRLRAALSATKQGGKAEWWISVDERLPGPGVAVLAFFRNTHGKGRVVRAHHAPKHTIEAGHWDEDVETDNTEDGSFEPEGWYEDPAVGETLSFISPQSDGVVTHWQPMPPAPAAQPQGDKP
ncbi:hypothetical protein QFZ42_003357 [Variovorax paradoxus]|uniref:DUF551 domain-containing protein n=1 Tax=Variovorax paradoxus TaxID=34073 RepID=UPI002790BA57|nr:DUF551 domain-containing protein [Variovorax paradoxus]MDQ0571523.1 hypothetical protein [Variovorax paradoxus]